MKKITAYLLISILLFSCNTSQKNEKQLNAEETSSAAFDSTLIKGMVLIPAGEANIGNNIGFEGERPEFTMRINAFYMDTSPVTVAQFKKFVESTGYITEAEKFGNGAVFDLQNKTWYLQNGATWRSPMGPKGPVAADNYPVTQVSWNDAQAYCKWAGKRLPTEFEWEYAASNADTTKTIYSWGTSLVSDKKYMANTWQGKFPEKNLIKDGFLYTSPVGYFGKNKLGLTDMGGNVWQWTSSWYQPYKNIINGTDDSASGQRTIKGGSFMCDTLFCWGYRVDARTGTSPETSLFHVGFRCALDAR